MIKPIETIYKGYKFRSRLEAKWAVFFDEVGVRWVYEPEGFDIDGKWYLPDFWLPDDEWFLEIKPTKNISQEDQDKIAALDDSSYDLPDPYKAQGVMVLIGEPEIPVSSGPGEWNSTYFLMWQTCGDERRYIDAVNFVRQYRF